ncbi:MAG: hypothetical protein ACREUU_00680 [Gammaproteobacteria bacterium]
MNLRIVELCIGAAMLAAVSMSVHAAQLSDIRSYTVADEGLLNLYVPRHWTDKRSELSIGLPRTIRFSANEGERFEVLFSARWSGRQDPTVVEPNFLLSVAAYGAKIVAPQAMEPELEVRSLPTHSGEAYVFAATDKDPKPGEYRYMVQGAMNVQGLVCTFTILSEQQNSPAVADAIEMIRTASFVAN